MIEVKRRTIASLHKTCTMRNAWQCAVLLVFQCFIFQTVDHQIIRSL